MWHTNDKKDWPPIGMIGDYLMIAAHCFHCQNKILSSFLRMAPYLVDESCSLLSYYVDSNQQFNIIGVYGFQSKYFSLILCSFPSGFFFFFFFNN